MEREIIEKLRKIDTTKLERLTTILEEHVDDYQTDDPKPLMQRIRESGLFKETTVCEIESRYA